MKSLFKTSMLLSLLVAASCESVPVPDPVLQNAAYHHSSPKIVGSNGILSDEEAKELLKDIGAGDLLARHVAIEQAISKKPLIADNHARLLVDGEETFRAIFAAIKGARRHINLEYYIFQDVQSDGVNLSDLLLKKRAEGVEINIIYDSFGSSDTERAFIDRLRKAGVRLVEFNSLDPLEATDSPNDRTHRKLCVVDGGLGIIGGINLSDTYEEGDVGKSTGPEGTTPEQWHDIDVELQGPVVAQLEALFLEHWKDQKGPPIDTRTFFPKSKDKGQELVRILGSVPDKDRPQYYFTLISAIRHSVSSVWLMTGYFVPTEELVEELKRAARRGVDVRLLLPAKSDSSVSISVQHTHYTDLLDAGVKIYELRDYVLHSKINVIDGVLTTIGSSNLDYRSVIHNDELDAVILSQNLSSGAEAIFTKDFKRSDRITKEMWDNRPLGQRVYEPMSRLLERFL